MKIRILVILAAALLTAACTTMATRPRQGGTASGSPTQGGTTGSELQGTSLNGVYQGITSNGRSVELETAHVVGGQLFVGKATAPTHR